MTVTEHERRRVIVTSQVDEQEVRAFCQGHEVV